MIGTPDESIYGRISMTEVVNAATHSHILRNYMCIISLLTARQTFSFSLFPLTFRFGATHIFRALFGSDGRLFLCVNSIYGWADRSAARSDGREPTMNGQKPTADEINRKTHKNDVKCRPRKQCNLS